MVSERVFISLGSNIGDRDVNLREATVRLSALSGVTLVAASSFYSSPPFGVTDQPDFFNAAAELRTTLQPDALLKALKGIETDMGREPARRWGERLIDLDIIFYGQRLISEPHLSIPHSHALERDFVLIPISEIASDFIVPGVGKRVCDLTRLISGSNVKLVSESTSPNYPILNQRARQ